MIGSDHVVWKLLSSDSPMAAMRVLIDEPAARSPNLLPTLDEVSNGNWVAAGERIDQVKRFLQQVHLLIPAFSRVRSLEQLAEVARTFTYYYWMVGFEALVHAFLADAKGKGDTVLAAGLEMALTVRLKAQSLVNRLNELNPRSPADLKSARELVAPDFLAWLGAIVHRAKFIDKDDAKASAYSSKIEILEYTRKLLQSFEEEHEQRDEHVIIRMPARPQEAELWFIPDDKLLWTYFSELAQRVRDGALRMDEAVLSAAERSSPEEAPTWYRNSSYVHGGAMFCGFAIHLFPELTPDGVREFRRWLGHPRMAQVPIAERLSNKLRYAMLLAPNYAVLPDPRSALEDALQLLDDAEPQTDGKKHPGLLRDILFTRARIRRETSRWVPSRVSEAIEDFQSGLAVEGGKYNREVRGRALGDLASALAAAPPGVRPTDSRILALYHEAIPLLTDFPASLATQLMNLAIFYNERTEETRRENQEQALLHINQAVSALESSEDKMERNSAYVRQLLAALELTRGNILLSRESGDHEQRRKLAIQAYHRALKFLPNEGFDILRGEIRLNLGYAHLTEASDPSEAERAFQQLDEAVALLSNSPHSYGLAVLARAEAWMHAPSDGTAGWWQQIAAVESARRTFLNRAEHYGAAQAHRRIAELQLFRAPDDVLRRRRAMHHFAAAASLFESVGELSRAISNLELEADLRVGLLAFEPERTQEYLRTARRSLERAMAHAKDLMLRDDSLSWRTEWSERRASLATHLLWVDANLGRDMDELWETARQAKANDLTRQLAELELRTRAPGMQEADSETARRLARLYEADFVRSLAHPQPEGDLTAVLRDAREASEEYRRELIDLELQSTHTRIPSPAAASSKHEAPPLNSLLCDINICTWGTVVLWSGRALPEEGARVVLPLHAGMLKVWLVGDGDTRGWFNAYVERRGNPGGWHEATTHLIQNLDEYLWAPCLDALSLSLEGAHLFISPGSLSGLPLHAGSVGGKRLLDLVEGLAWLPKPEFPRDIGKVRPFRNVLCLLSDPDIKGSARLHAAPEEVVKVANILAGTGAAVTVLASSDVSVGRAVFERRSLALPEHAQILEQRPTPEWVQEHLHSFDLIFYAGHGLSGDNQEPELLLVDEQGRYQPLRLFDLLSARTLEHHPLVLLSACETALENSGSPGEPFNLALAFLRLGACGTVGTLWVVEDQLSAKFSASLCSELATGCAPEVAFVKALRIVSGGNATAWAPFCYWVAPRLTLPVAGS